MAEEEEKKHGREKKHRRKTQWGGGKHLRETLRKRKSPRERDPRK